jgi:hypothetical protein
MKYIAYILTVLLIASASYATGWNDFELDIGDGYNIYRANSFDVGIAHSNHVLIGSGDYSVIGPVYGYYVTNDLIFARAYGNKKRNHFEGDTYKLADYSNQYYFILRKGVDEITGPLSLKNFQKDPIVQNHSPILWIPPRNPNVLLPLFGSLMFLAFAIPILAIKYFWVTIPLLAIITLLIRHSWKKHKQKAQPAGSPYDAPRRVDGDP